MYVSTKTIGFLLTFGSLPTRKVTNAQASGPTGAESKKVPAEHFGFGQGAEMLIGGEKKKYQKEYLGWFWLSGDLKSGICP